MSDTPETTEAQEEGVINFEWLVANVFAIIHFLESKFGPAAVEEIVLVSREIERQMGEEDSQ